MTTATNLIGNVIIESGNKSYEVTIINNIAKVVEGESFANFRLPSLENGSLDLDSFTEEYVLRNAKKEIDSNMRLVQYNRTKVKKSLAGILESNFKKPFEDFNEQEELLYKGLILLIESAMSITEFIVYLKYTLNISTSEEFILLNPKIADELIAQSIDAHENLTTILNVIKTAENILSVTDKDLNTDYICILPSEKQKIIYIRLLKAGYTADETEQLMNERVCSLKGLISLEGI